MATFSSQALSAISGTATFLAMSWIQSGTWMGLALVNTRFSRMCVLDGRSKPKNRPISTLSFIDEIYLPNGTHPSNKVKIALEVPLQTLRRFPNGVFDCTELVEGKLADASHLLANDIVEGSSELHPNDVQAGEFEFNHTAVQVLWDMLHEAVRTLGSLAWGQALDSLESPSLRFRQYADTIIDGIASTARPTDHRAQVGPVSLEDIRFAMKPFDNDARMREWLRGTGTSPKHTPPALGTHGKKKEIEMRDNVRDSATTPSPAANKDTRRVLLYFVSSEGMDRLLHLRAVAQLPIVPEPPVAPKMPISRGSSPHPWSRSCCFV